MLKQQTQDYKLLQSNGQNCTDLVFVMYINYQHYSLSFKFNINLADAFIDSELKWLHLKDKQPVQSEHMMWDQKL